MANLSNINNILRISSSGVGLNKDNTGPSELDIESAGADMIDMTRTGLKTYRFAISGSSDFSIFDVAANSDRLIINTSGNATFAGNVTATNILTVAGAATGSPFLQFTQGGSQKAYIQYADSGDSFELQTDNQFVVRTGGSTAALTINSSQNTTFAGSVSAQDLLLPDGADVAWAGGYASSKPVLAANGTTMKMYPSGVTSGIQFSLSPTQAYFAGNVGIGTTSPGVPLHVVRNSAGQSLRLQQTGSNLYTEMQFQTPTGNMYIFVNSSGYSSYGGANATNFYTSNGAFAFHSNAGNNHFYIANGGNVGLGTTTPDYKLEVQGDTYINGRDFGKPINYATAQGWTAISSNLNSVQGYFGGSFNRNGASNENKIEWDYNYAGQRALIWRTQNNDAGSNDDGGWNKDITVASNNMGYMSVVYVKRNTSSSNGTFYHGCSGANTLYLTGTANTNPYFHNFGVGTLPQDVWCVSIGFLQANNDSNTANNPVGGVYRLDTGAKISGSSTFKMGTDSLIRQSHRVYLYYSTDVNQNLSFSDPGFYALDGSQPSISDLFGAGVPTPSSSSPFGQALKTYSSSAVVTVATTVNASTVSPKVSGHITITASTGASIIVKTFGIYETSNWWFKDEASPDIENGNNDIEITCSGNATNTLTFTVGDPTPVAGYGMTVSIQASPPGFFNL